MDKVFAIIGTVMFYLMILLAIGLVMAFPTLWLWNWLMPAIFGLTKITLLQAFGINILAGILFKGNTNSTSKSE